VIANEPLSFPAETPTMVTPVSKLPPSARPVKVSGPRPPRVMMLMTPPTALEP
jgi:hypothetical protein